MLKRVNTDLEKVLEVVLKECNTKMAVKKSEHNHFNFGKAFCLHSILNSCKIDISHIKLFEVIYENLI